MRKGSLTILLSFLMAATLVVLLVLTEYARVYSLRRLIVQSGQSAIDSVFSEYDRELLEDYGLMFYEGGCGRACIDYESIENEFENYFLRNSGENDKTLLRISECDAVLNETVSATDYNGEIFLRSVLDFYKYDAAGKMKDEITESLNLFGEGESYKSKSENATEQMIGFGGLSGEGDSEKKRQILCCSFEEPETDREEIPEFNKEKYQSDLSGSGIGAMANVKAKGALALVLPDSSALSGTMIDKSEFPSETSRDERLLSDRSFLENALYKIALIEYLLDYMNNFTSGSDPKGAAYETEYVLSGEASDAENLKSVVDKLLWIREAMNLMHIYTSGKSQEATAMATALFSWTGIPGIGEIGGAALSAAWAYGEAILDVRSLLTGGTVPILKDEYSWKLGLSGLTDVFNGVFPESSSSEDGMTYRDYLRVLLYLEDTSDLAYAAMDMIQMHMQAGRPDFFMESQLYEMSFSVQSVSKPFFTALPILTPDRFRLRDYRRTDFFTELY